MKRLNEEYKEFLQIYKLVNRQKIIDFLKAEIQNNKKKKVYELSDGILSARSIGKRAGVSHVSVTIYWKQWIKSGIVEETDTEGRYKAIFSLDNYGLNEFDFQKGKE